MAGAADVLAVDQPSDVLRVEIRFKNARLYDAIVAAAPPIIGDAKSNAGGAAQARGRINAFCKFYGFPSQHVYELLNLRKGPFGKFKEGVRLREICQRLAGILEREPKWLFPPELYEHTWRTLVRNVDGQAVGRLVKRMQPSLDQGESVASDPTSLVLSRERSSAVSDTLMTLTPREARVLAMRFGLEGDGDPKPRDAIASSLGVTRARIHQVEASALRKLRHPSRARLLAPYYPNPNEALQLAKHEADRAAVAEAKAAREAMEADAEKDRRRRSAKARLDRRSKADAWARPFESSDHEPSNKTVRLSDLNPAWLYTEDQSRVAIDFDCPCGCGSRCRAPFTNPIGSAPPNPGGWQRQGDSVFDLSLDPSVYRESGCRWRGALIGGVFIRFGGA